jgi:hypothetical protein
VVTTTRQRCLRRDVSLNISSLIIHIHNAEALSWFVGRKKQRILSKQERLLEDSGFINPKVFEAEDFGIQKSKLNVSTASVIEPMRKGENLRSFQQRVKAQTAQALMKEIPKLRKSAIRRKEKMKAMKQKKKTIKVDDYDVSVLSDRVEQRSSTSPNSFPSDGIAFGERVTEPPRLQDFVESLTKAAEKSRAKAVLREASTSTLRPASR